MASTRALLLALLALVRARGRGRAAHGRRLLRRRRASTRQARRIPTPPGVLSPPAPAPPLALRNYLGQPVNIASYRGKAVLVTFLYTQLP